jgi:cytochrome c-type biogenesis protein CcmE
MDASRSFSMRYIALVVWSAQVRGRALLAGLLVVMAAVWGWLAYGGEQVTYSRTVDEIVRDAQTLEGKRTRADGVLVPSSLERGGSPCTARFVLSGVQAQLHVVYRSCALPDFCVVPGWDLHVVAEGELDASTGLFEAERVFARCPNRYEMKMMGSDGGSGAGCRCFGAPSSAEPHR